MTGSMFDGALELSFDVEQNCFKQLEHNHIVTARNTTVNLIDGSNGDDVEQY